MLDYPLIFRTLVLPTFDQLKRLKFGKYLTELEKTQWWSTAELVRMQEERLSRLVEHVYQQVPYYREVMDQHHLRPEDIRQIGDLVKFPLLTRELVRARGNDLRARDHESRRSRIKSTGGTTGEPLQYLIDWDAWSHITACRYRGEGFGGYRPGDKMAILAGSSLIPDSQPGFTDRLRWKIERNLPLPAVKMTPEIMAGYARKIQAFKPSYLIGYPTALYVLADYIESHGILITGLRGVFTTAEALLPNHRQVLETVFKCPVFDAYGCGDGGIVATECKEHRGLHLAMEHAIIEVLGADGIPTQCETGKFIVTDLFNYAQPFVRYEVGDVGKYSEETCPCGRGLRMLESVDGRTTDILRFNNGVTLSGPAITLMFRDTNILQYQLVQNDGDSLLVNIRRSENTTEEDFQSVKNILVGHLGSEVNVEMKTVEDIPPTKSGKRRFIISNIH
jgi:phenylacetate-CoA ligase